MSSPLNISGPIGIGSLAANPSNPKNGFIYYNSADNEFRMYKNGTWLSLADEEAVAALTGTDIAYARADGSKKNIDAASDDLESAISDLDDAIGALEATPTNYTPTDASIVADHLAAIDAALVSAGGTEFADNAFRINDNVDATKQIAFEAAAITTSTLRTITMPDADVDLGDISINTGAIDANTIDIADLRTLSGTADGDTDLGTFTGATIPDASAIKPALQSLETSLETKAADADVIKKDGSVDFTADQSMGGFKLTSLAAGTASGDAVNKSQLDAVSSLIENFEWQDSALDYIVDNTLVPPTEVSGDRYILSHDGGAPNAAWDGASAGDIVEFDGASWVATTPTLGTFISADDESDVLYYWGGAAWSTKAFESTTASTGLTKVGFDVRLDASAAGDGLGFASGVLSVNVDDATIEIDTDTLRIKALGVDTAQLAAGAVTDAKVASGIDAAKLADGSVSNTEFQYLDGVTSAIQTQLNAKLENVVEDTTPELGGDLEVGANAIEGAANEILLAGQNSVRRAKQASKSSFIEEEYLHAVSLAASQTNTVIAALTFAHATIEGLEIVYKIKEATSNDVRIGTLRVVTNGTDVALNDVSTETADTGISFDAVVNGANINVRYSSGANAATLRADVKKILA